MAQANVKLTVDASGATRALKNVQTQTSKLQSAFGGLRTALAFGGLTFLAKNAVTTSTNFERLNVRLGLLTKASGTFTKSTKIAADAQKAFGLSAIEALEGVSDITARLAPLKVGVEDIRTVFFGFNTAAKLAGANTIEASNAFRQLAQALGSGRLAGDEFRSVSEQVPTILAPIAAELGVNIGELKKFAAEGKLTSEVVLRALGRVGKDGSKFLKQLLENDPTQVFKNLSNETENLSRAIGDLLKPAVLAGTKELTKLVSAVTDLVNSDITKASLLISGVVLSVKALTVAIPFTITALSSLVTNLQITAATSYLTTTGLTGVSAAAFVAAGGVSKLTVAVTLFKTAIATTGIGLLVVGVGALVTQLIKANKEQKQFNKTLKEGTALQLRAEMDKVDKRRFELLKRLAIAEENNNKRAINSINKQLKIEEDIYTQLRNRLHEEIKKTNEIDKQNKKLKEQEEQIKKNKEATEKLLTKMQEVGEEIENSIKSNLKDAITGAQSFGDAMVNVLNRIRDKIIENQIEKLLGGFGEAFSAGATGGDRKGIGGFLGGLLGGLFKENGGPVKAGQPYIVGEKRPELFVPRTSGTILPSVPSGGSMSVVVNVDATGSSVEGDEQSANEFGEQIASVVQAVIINEKRVGGLLN